MFDALAYLAYQLVDVLSGSLHPVLAIVAATVLVRFALLPVAAAAHRADARRAEVLGSLPADASARVDALRTHGGSLLRGCLPTIVQLPIFAALYRLAVSPTIQGQANTLLQQTLFGAPLGAHLGALAGSQVVVFVVLIALIAVIGYLSSRLLRPAGDAATGAGAVIARVAPYASAGFALFLPLAAAIYLATTAAFTLAQTVFLRSL